MGKCIQCGKETDKPSWCSAECVDIYEGNAPRRSAHHVFDERVNNPDPGEKGNPDSPYYNR